MIQRMMKSAVSWPLEGRDPLRVGWISTLMELRQDVNLRSCVMAHGWGFYPSHRPNRATSRTRHFRQEVTEGLEERLAMSATTPAIQMLSATTTDSKSVTIEYQVNQAPDATNPIQFGIYRSSNSQFDSSDSLVDTITLAAPGSASGQSAITLDQNGQSAIAVGTHQLTIPLAQGLPPYPEKPYVLVVADPSSPAATTDPAQTASFRVYTIGIVTHGGIQDPSWKHGPPWEIETAYMMRHEGFDSVIGYNWVLQSSTPGAAIKQSPRLARMILDVASKFPANDPVDLEFIGHSEGTVVNTYAIVTLEREMTPQLTSGYIEDTLLDPHAANNNVPGQQMSFGGALGGLARAIVTNYQAEAKDPARVYSVGRRSGPGFLSSTHRPRPARSTTSGARFPSKATGPWCITTI